MRFLAWTGLAVAMLSLLVAATADAQGPPPPTGITNPVPIDVTIAVVNFANYDAKQGSYVLDFYLVLRWDPHALPASISANFTPASFEFANGRATSRELQFDQTDNATGVRSLWYRIQAELFSDPKFDAYPFDAQTVEIRLEDKVHPARELIHHPDTKGSGLEESFTAAGWEVRGWTFETRQNTLSFDEPYSQARFVITLHRSTLSGVLKVLVPPIAFVIVSGVSFFLLGADKIATRFALTANMAISGVLFHAGQSASLPSLSRLIFLDRYMLAIDVLLFGSVLVTAIVALIEMKWKDAAKAKRVNLRGAIVVPAVAAGVFVLLHFA